MVRIKEIRNGCNISQKQLAAYLGISQGNLCDWEKGRSQPDIDMLIKIADYLEVSVDNLIGRNSFEHSGKSGNDDAERIVTAVRNMPVRDLEKLKAVMKVLFDGKYAL